MLSLLLCLALRAAAAQSQPLPGEPYAAFLAGPAFTAGSLDAFTQETRTSPKAQSSRGYGVGGDVGARIGFWLPDSPWGATADLSYLELPVDGGGLRALEWGFKLLLRPPRLAEGGVFPYLGIGPMWYAFEARTDYLPETAAKIKKLAGAEVDSVTFEACLGLQARLSRALLLFTEARVTRLPLDYEYTPASFPFGSAQRFKNGISTDAYPVSIRIGLGVSL